jgi:hypothetical protein
MFVKLFFNILILCVINASAYSQNQSAGFYIERGSQVPFVFNTIAKLETGATYTDWTRIRIKMQEVRIDALDTFAVGWTLSFRALTATIPGERGVPADDLPLNTLRLSSTDNSTAPLNKMPLL